MTQLSKDATGGATDKIKGQEPLAAPESFEHGSEEEQDEHVEEDVAKTIDVMQELVGYPGKRIPKGDAKHDNFGPCVHAGSCW